MITSERIPEGKGWTYFALTAEQYENTARNLAELTRWAQEASWQLNYYHNGLKKDAPK